MRLIDRTWQVVAFFMMLGACGSGGGTGADGGPTGGTRGGGSGGSGGYGMFTVTPEALTFTATQGGPLPPSQSVHVHRDDTYLQFGSSFPQGFPPPWLREDTFAHGDTTSSDFDLVFSIATSDLTPGTYATTYTAQNSQHDTCSAPGSCVPGATVAERTVEMTYVLSAP